MTPSPTPTPANSDRQLAPNEPPAPRAVEAPAPALAADVDDDEDEDYNDDNEDDADDERSAYGLHDLVQEGALERLRALLPRPSPAAAANSSEDVDGLSRMAVLAAESRLLEKDDMGCLPIHIALIHQQLDCALHILGHSEALTMAMLRMKCADLNTPLVHLALRVGAINPRFTAAFVNAFMGPEAAGAWGDDLRMLLAEALGTRDDEGNNVFHLCAMFDLDDVMDTLVRFYCRQMQPTLDAASAPTDAYAAFRGVPELMTLMERGNRLGLRPLHVAMKFASTRVTGRLLGALKVSVNVQTSLQQTPAHIAAAHGALECGRLLASGPTRADFSLVDAYGHSPGTVAARCGFQALAELFGHVDDAAATTTTTGATNPPTTRFLFHPEALEHLPQAVHRRGGVEPPPENPERIRTLVDPVYGILRAREFQGPHIAWDHDIPRADVADILRVHEYHYVRRIRQSCEDLTGGPGTVILDPDTSLSSRSFDAAARAAGAVCRAVDQVVGREVTNAFCIVRPPGHHAGPTGKVPCANDPEGSHGFCVFNNVAIGAAYARSQYKRAGIERIAILDFDVHHGNGTEEIVRQLVPSMAELAYETPYGTGRQVVHQYKPWRSEDDGRNVFFSSVHGYGHKDPEGEFASAALQAAWFYPGSGPTAHDDTDPEARTNPSTGPAIWNVGLPFCREGAAVARLQWRSAFRDEILPKLVAFGPDLIFLSAGFDAHKKETVNWGYVSLLEQDYEWLVHHVKRVANTCCGGRLISVLEGGYNFHGRMVSPFARSVAAHARALACPSREAWSPAEVAKEAAHERSLLAHHSRPLATAETPLVPRKRATTAAAPKAPATAAPAAVTAPTSRLHDGDGSRTTIAQGRSKRARKHVDYVALAAELDEAAAAHPHRHSS